MQSAASFASASHPLMAGLVQSSRWLPDAFSTWMRPLDGLTVLPASLNVVPVGKALTSSVPDHGPLVLAPLDE